MVKFFVKPSRSASARSMRTHMEWKVDTHMPRERVPTSCAKRSRISAAALLVKVMARISHGAARSCSRMLAMRYVSTRVLPEPAPASTRSGPSVVTTASRCGPFKVSMSMGMERSCFFHFFDRQQSGWRQCANRAVWGSLNGSP